MSDDPEETPLHDAAMGCRLEELQNLLAAGADPNEFDEFAKTPLHWAADTECFGAISILVGAGADVNAMDETQIGNTPLAAVAGRCSVQLARQLLDAGADPTIPGWMKLSALDRAARREDEEGSAVYALFVEHVRANRA